MQVLAVSGSLQATSSNTRFVARGARTSRRKVSTSSCSSASATLPHFNPDLEARGDPAVLAPVTELRGRIAAADGVLIASPEYAHEMPGSLKNALDWIVGSGELYGKRVAIVVRVAPVRTAACTHGRRSSRRSARRARSSCRRRRWRS